MKIELTRELRHHLPGEGHPAIEAFNHFLAAAASLSNVKTGTDRAPLKESFERAKQILLDAGFQYRKIDTDTFTVWPVGTPCFETLGDNYNPDEVVTAIAHVAPPAGHQACWAKITPEMPPPCFTELG